MASQFIEMWKQAGRKINHAPFDISKRVTTGTPVSLIQPLAFFETNPNEKFELDLQGLLRSETLNTAAFVNGTFVVNAFFVPYAQLWHNFPQFVVQKKDEHSSAYKFSNFCPHTSLYELEFFIVQQLAYTLLVKYKHLAPVSVDLLDIITKYRTVYSSSLYFFKLAIPKLVRDEHGYPVVYNLLRSFQFYKFGNLYWLYNALNGIASASNWDGANKAEVTANISECVHDAFDYIDSILSADENKVVNLFRPLAYQHIFYDYYRNNFFDDAPFFQSAYKDGIRYVDTFNVDDLRCDTFGNSGLSFDNSVGVLDNSEASWYNTRLLNIMSLRYHKYKNDIYTTAMNSTQFGAVSSVQGLSTELQFSSNSAVTDVNFEGHDFDTEDFYNYILVGGDSFRGDSFNIPSFFDVLSLRKAELLQQWKQNALRAGNKVEDNFKQHFGVEPYYYEDNYVRFLGSWSAAFNINPVTATSSTGAEVNGQVGDLAAIGVGTMSGKKQVFECQDHGVIVFCGYFLPDTQYSANGIDRANMLSEPFDFYSEEFENVGFETLPWSIQNSQDKYSYNSNLGYVPPFSMYKTNVDECFGEFSTVVARDANDGQPFEFVGSMIPWVTQRKDTPATRVDGVYYRDKSAYYCNPAVFNSLFAIEYDGSTKTEPFALAINFDVKALRPMSVLGLPQFS